MKISEDGLYDEINIMKQHLCNLRNDPKGSNTEKIWVGIF